MNLPTGRKFMHHVVSGSRTPTRAKKDDLIGDLEKSLFSDPHNIAAHNKLADISFEKRSYEKAYQHYYLSYKEDSSQVDLLLKMAAAKFSLAMEDNLASLGHGRGDPGSMSLSQASLYLREYQTKTETMVDCERRQKRSNLWAAVSAFDATTILAHANREMAQYLYNYTEGPVLPLLVDNFRCAPFEQRLLEQITIFPSSFVLHHRLLSYWTLTSQFTSVVRHIIHYNAAEYGLTSNIEWTRWSFHFFDLLAERCLSPDWQTYQQSFDVTEILIWQLKLKQQQCLVSLAENDFSDLVVQYDELLADTTSLFAEDATSHTFGLDSSLWTTWKGEFEAISKSLNFRSLLRQSLDVSDRTTLMQNAWDALSSSWDHADMNKLVSWTLKDDFWFYTDWSVLSVDTNLARLQRYSQDLKLAYLLLLSSSAVGRKTKATKAISKIPFGVGLNFDFIRLPSFVTLRSLLETAVKTDMIILAHCGAVLNAFESVQKQLSFYFDAGMPEVISVIFAYLLQAHCANSVTNLDWTTFVYLNQAQDDDRISGHAWSSPLQSWVHLNLNSPAVNVLPLASPDVKSLWSHLVAVLVGKEQNMEKRFVEEYLQGSAASTLASTNAKPNILNPKAFGVKNGLGAGFASFSPKKSASQLKSGSSSTIAPSNASQTLDYIHFKPHEASSSLAPHSIFFAAVQKYETSLLGSLATSKPPASADLSPSMDELLNILEWSAYRLSTSVNSPFKSGPFSLASEVLSSDAVPLLDNIFTSIALPQYQTSEWLATQQAVVFLIGHVLSLSKHMQLPAGVIQSVIRHSGSLHISPDAWLLSGEATLILSSSSSTGLSSSNTHEVLDVILKKLHALMTLLTNNMDDLSQEMAKEVAANFETRLARLDAVVQNANTSNESRSAYSTPAKKAIPSRSLQDAEKPSTKEAAPPATPLSELKSRYLGRLNGALSTLAESKSKTIELPATQLNYLSLFSDTTAVPPRSIPPGTVAVPVVITVPVASSVPIVPQSSVVSISSTVEAEKHEMAKMLQEMARQREEAALEAERLKAMLQESQHIHLKIAEEQRALEAQREALQKERAALEQLRQGHLEAEKQRKEEAKRIAEEEHRKIAALARSSSSDSGSSEQTDDETSSSGSEEAPKSVPTTFGVKPRSSTWSFGSSPAKPGSFAASFNNHTPSPPKSGLKLSLGAKITAFSTVPLKSPPSSASSASSTLSANSGAETPTKVPPTKPELKFGLGFSKVASPGFGAKQVSPTSPSGPLSASSKDDTKPLAKDAADTQTKQNLITTPKSDVSSSESSGSLGSESSSSSASDNTTASTTKQETKEQTPLVAPHSPGTRQVPVLNLTKTTLPPTTQEQLKSPIKSPEAKPRFGFGNKQAASTAPKGSSFPLSDANKDAAKVTGATSAHGAKPNPFTSGGLSTKPGATSYGFGTQNTPTHPWAKKTGESQSATGSFGTSEQKPVTSGQIRISPRGEALSSGKSNRISPRTDGTSSNASSQNVSTPASPSSSSPRVESSTETTMLDTIPSPKSATSQTATTPEETSETVAKTSAPASPKVEPSAEASTTLLKADSPRAAPTETQETNEKANTSSSSSPRSEPSVKASTASTEVSSSISTKADAEEASEAKKMETPLATTTVDSPKSEESKTDDSTNKNASQAVIPPSTTDESAKDETTPKSDLPSPSSASTPKTPLGTFGSGFRNLGAQGGANGAGAKKTGFSSPGTGFGSGGFGKGFGANSSFGSGGFGKGFGVNSSFGSGGFGTSSAKSASTTEPQAPQPTSEKLIAEPSAVSPRAPNDDETSSSSSWANVDDDETPASQTSPESPSTKSTIADSSEKLDSSETLATTSVSAPIEVPKEESSAPSSPKPLSSTIEASSVPIEFVPSVTSTKNANEASEAEESPSLKTDAVDPEEPKSQDSTLKDVVQSDDVVPTETEQAKAKDTEAPISSSAPSLPQVEPLVDASTTALAATSPYEEPAALDESNEKSDEPSIVSSPRAEPPMAETSNPHELVSLEQAPSPRGSLEESDKPTSVSPKPEPPIEETSPNVTNVTSEVVHTEPTSLMSQEEPKTETHSSDASPSSPPPVSPTESTNASSEAIASIPSSVELEETSEAQDVKIDSTTAHLEATKSDELQAENVGQKEASTHETAVDTGEPVKNEPVEDEQPKASQAPSEPLISPVASADLQSDITHLPSTTELETSEETKTDAVPQSENDAATSEASKSDSSTQLDAGDQVQSSSGEAGDVTDLKSVSSSSSAPSEVETAANTSTTASKPVDANDILADATDADLTLAEEVKPSTSLPTASDSLLQDEVPTSEAAAPRKALEDATEATFEDDSDFGDEDPVSDSPLPTSNPLKDMLKGDLGDDDLLSDDEDPVSDSPLPTSNPLKDTLGDGDFDMVSDDDEEKTSTSLTTGESSIQDAVPTSPPRKALEDATEATFEDDSDFGDEDPVSDSPLPTSNLLKDTVGDGDFDMVSDDEELTSPTTGESTVQDASPTSEHPVSTLDDTLPRKALEDATEATFEDDSDFGDEDPVSDSPLPTSNPLKDMLKGDLGDDDLLSDDE